MQGLQKANKNGLIPSEFAEENYLDYEKVGNKILKWEKEQKITCIDKKITHYISKYILTKYTPNIIN